LLKGIPVLMYHAVTPATEEEDVGHIHVSLQVFTAQMQWLAAEGYTTLTIPELLEQTNHPGTTKKVVLTFDDGYASLYTLVTPLLQQYGFKATLFVTTATVGADSYAVLPHFERSFPPNDRPLSWQELQEMEQGCWDIQPHGHQHLAHNRLPQQELLAEIAESKRQVELYLNKRTDCYAFPYGRYNYACLQLLPELGFKAAFTVQPGLTAREKLFQLPRVEINKFDTLPLFTHKMLTGYRDPQQRIRSFFTQFIYRNPRLKDSLKRIRDRFLHA
jgi:peptidoglycan/xylan/chitin deacetylase (PgdA/CDA1 family)